MTERRYGFRFSAVEAGMLVVSVLLASVFIFLSGVYVGKGVEAHRTTEQTAALRIPVTTPNEVRAPVANTPLAWNLPKDKQTESQSSVPPQTNLVKKTPEGTALPKERVETAVEKPRPKTEERSPSSPREKALLAKEVPPPSEMKTQTDTEEVRAADVRTAAVQPWPNEKPAEAMKASPAQKGTSGAKKWKVQVEATSREEVAQEVAQALRAQGYAPSVSRITKEGQVLYRVRVGRFATQEEAIAAMARFRNDGRFPQAYPVSE
jgi:cell division septation protein DedD